MLSCTLFCILYTLSSILIVLIVYVFCIYCCISFWLLFGTLCLLYKRHILHILPTISHIGAYCAYWCILVHIGAYCREFILFTYFAYHLAYYFAYCAYKTTGIFCILKYIEYFAYSKWKGTFSRSFIIHSIFCLVPNPRGQLLMHHYLQPSSPFLLLSQAASEKSANSLRMSKGIVPVVSTGTSRTWRRNMEETEMTYKACNLSRRSKIMADWHLSTQAEERERKSRICENM
jgi:hypothetical protein